VRKRVTVSVFTGVGPQGDYTVVNLRPGFQPEPVYIITNTPFYRVPEGTVIVRGNQSAYHQYGNREACRRGSPTGNS